VAAAARGVAVITGVATGTATSITGAGETEEPADESAGPTEVASPSRAAVGSAADDDSNETSGSGVVLAELLSSEPEAAGESLPSAREPESVVESPRVRSAPAGESAGVPDRDAELDEPAADGPEAEPVEPVVSANATVIEAIAEPTPNATASANTRPT